MFSGFICNVLDFLLYGPPGLIESPIGSFLFDIFIELCDRIGF